MRQAAHGPLEQRRKHRESVIVVVTMNAEDTTLLRQLLHGSRVLALGVLVDGAPYVGLLPYASSADHRALLVHASGLARHSRGLGDGAPFSALVHGPEADAP